MRLTDDIMRASDEATTTRISNALALASVGRFGLLPGSRWFQLSLKLNANSVEVQTLDCLAVTRDGSLIDAQINTKYTDYINKSVYFPDDKGNRELFLTISVDPKQWKETLNGFEEPDYAFDLVGVNSPIPDNALPLAHLYQGANGWYVDEEDFLPPCLFVSSHPSYVELLNQFLQKLSEVESKVFRLIQPGSHEAFRVFWPFAQQILIDADKNRDTMTPMALLGNIQKFVDIFTAACHLDQYLNLSDAETFRNYALAPYNYMNVYPMIKEGLKYCFIINEKVDKIEVKRSEPTSSGAKPTLVAPSISDDLLYQNCRTSIVTIPIINNAPGANVFFSCDGSMPSKPVSNGKVKIKNSFKPVKVEEPDQEIVIKLKAVLNGAESDVSTFNLILHKDYKVWIQI